MDGLNTFYQICFAFSCKSFFEAGLIAGGKGEVKVDKRASSQQWTHMDEPREDPPCDEREPRLVPYRTKWKVHQRNRRWD